MDTGIDYNHPDIAANVWTNKNEIPGNGTDDDHNGYVDDIRGWDFIGSSYLTPQQSNDPIDHNGHGTHVAGTIAAVGNNGIGVIGVAWSAQVMAVKGLDDTGTGDESTLGPAIIYAANNGADVISASWGSTESSQTIADAISYAYNMGAVIVVAAGNNSGDALNFYPAALWNVITVAASDPNDNLASFSNYGSKIDVTAPGVDILSLQANGTQLGPVVSPGYIRLSGTSMATPHVSGLAALILSENPEYSNEELRQVLRSSATDVGTPGYDLSFGYGRENAAVAVGVSGALEAKISSPLDGAVIQGQSPFLASPEGTDSLTTSSNMAADRSRPRGQRFRLATRLFPAPSARSIRPLFPTALTICALLCTTLRDKASSIACKWLRIRSSFRAHPYLRRPPRRRPSRTEQLYP